MKKLLSMFLAAGLLQSCVSTMPGPVATRHVTTEGAGFMLQGQPRRVHYGVSYTFRDLGPGDYAAVVEFQNPAAQEQPLRVVKRFRYPAKNLQLESPALQSVRSGENYEVRLVLHKHSEAGPVVDRHSQQVNFGIPREMATRLGLATRIE